MKTIRKYVPVLELLACAMIVFAYVFKLGTLFIVIPPWLIAGAGYALMQEKLSFYIPRMGKCAPFVRSPWNVQKYAWINSIVLIPIIAGIMFTIGSEPIEDPAPTVFFGVFGVVILVMMFNCLHLTPTPIRRKNPDALNEMIEDVDTLCKTFGFVRR